MIEKEKKWFMSLIRGILLLVMQAKFMTIECLRSVHSIVYTVRLNRSDKNGKRYNDFPVNPKNIESKVYITRQK